MIAAAYLGVVIVLLSPIPLASSLLGVGPASTHHDRMACAALFGFGVLLIAIGLL